MILADTSIWIDHFRSNDTTLATLLEQGLILVHTFVLGELALGDLRQRSLILPALSRLLHATLATDDEVMHLIDRERLFATGIGYIDAHLLAATRLTPHAALWTRDKRLRAAAERLSLAASVES